MDVRMVLNEEQITVYHELEREIEKQVRLLSQEFEISITLDLCRKSQCSYYLRRYFQDPKPSVYTLTNLKAAGMATYFIDQHENQYHIFVFTDFIMNDIFFGVQPRVLADFLSTHLRHEVGHCLAYKLHPGYKELVKDSEFCAYQGDTMETYYAQPVEEIANQLVGITPASLINSWIEFENSRYEGHCDFWGPGVESSSTTVRYYPDHPYAVC